MTQRRSLLKLLASSPLIGASTLQLFVSDLLAQDKAAPLKPGSGRRLPRLDSLLNLFDFQPIASRTIPPAHFGFLTTGVDGDRTKIANHRAYEKYHLRPRMLVDVSKVDTRVELFGESWASPVFLSPIAAQKAFHKEGEIAVAKAAKAKDLAMFLSTMSSTAIEDVITARGRSVWFQLYATAEWEITKKLLRRAEKAGCKVVALTVDLPISANKETQRRLARRDAQDCSQCHQGLDEDIRRKPMFEDTEIKGIADLRRPDLTWDFIARLRDETKMKLLIKGIVTKEDAKLCLKKGVDGILVSNHGGRAAESGRGAVDSLAEIMPVVGKKVPVLVDGGVRRGTDVFKALALGASAVGIGRPYIWGLGPYGQPGVEAVLGLLHKELTTTMKLAGTTSVDEITGAYVGTQST